MNSKSDLESMIRVNHAGEYGAVRIYEGQLAVLNGSPHYDKILHMKEQEEHHLETFDTYIKQRRVRPTALQPLWHVAGYAMGALSAALGEKAAMACTDAVESVIDEHYQDQLKELADSEPELCATIEKFREEELEHQALAIAEGAHQAPAYPVISGAIKAATRFAIWASKRV